MTVMSNPPVRQVAGAGGALGHSLQQLGQWLDESQQTGGVASRAFGTAIQCMPVKHDVTGYVESEIGASFRPADYPWGPQKRHPRQSCRLQVPQCTLGMLRRRHIWRSGLGQMGAAPSRCVQWLGPAGGAQTKLELEFPRFGGGQRGADLGRGRKEWGEFSFQAWWQGAAHFFR